jgi:amidase
MDKRVPRSAPPSHTAPRDLRKPPLGELQRIAQQYGMDLSTDDLTSLGNLMGGVLASYRRLDQFVEPTLPVKYPRQTGHRPGSEENRLNAWYWKSSVKGAPDGKLAGKTIVEPLG